MASRPSIISRLFGRRASTFALRCGYVLSLVLIGAICAYFFLQQRTQNSEINRIGALAEQFAVLDTLMEDIAYQAERTATRFPSEAPDLGPRVAGMSMQERREYRATLPIDPAIIAVKTSLLYRLDKGRIELEGLRAYWRDAPPALREQIIASSPYMLNRDPFQHHTLLLDDGRVNAARSTFDMHWTARELFSLYENNVAVSNRRAQIQIRSYLEALSARQGDTLQQFFLITIGALVALLFLVFIPVDIAIQRMMAKLSIKTAEADRALVKAQAADRAKSEFLANMSHEIRTPMNGVLGMAELLSKTELNAKQRTFADIIVKSGNALLTIINDILDFSKIDANQIELDPAPFTLSETVEDVATLVSGRVAEKDLELIVRVQPDLPRALIGDVGRLRQILTNLVGNAVKFTEVGHVLVDVSGSSDGSTARLCFMIEDTGIGIPEDKLAAVFEKFSQVDNSSTRRHEGTGLGLAIARRLVELMGGTMSVRSVFGKGSVFSFTLDMPVHGKGLDQRRDVPSDIGGAGVLVIEDNPINRAILTEQFESWKLECIAVEDGATGLAFLREAAALGVTVDLVVLDYQMPEMTGDDVARAIRGDTRIARTPILLLSSVDQVENMRFVRELGIEGQLSKPARSSLLLETVTSIIQKSRAAAVRAEPAAPGPAPQAQPAHAPETRSQPVSPEPAAKAPRAEGDVDILVAEDNEVNQIVFTQALEQLPYRFKIVGNGRLALMHWEKLRPSLILMDVSMPEMNGHEATEAIRRREAELNLARTPIVGVTAHALKGDREKCIEAGMDDYMSKPISPDRLAEKVNSWIGRDDGVRRSA